MILQQAISCDEEIVPWLRCVLDVNKCLFAHFPFLALECEEGLERRGLNVWRLMSVIMAWLALTCKTKTHRELVFDVACYQTHRMGHGQHPKWWMNGWMDGNSTRKWSMEQNPQMHIGEFKIFIFLRHGTNYQVLITAMNALRFTLPLLRLVSRIYITGLHSQAFMDM